MGNWRGELETKESKVNRVNTTARARNYKYEIRIGGPNRGDLVILSGHVYRNVEAIESVIEALETLSVQSGFEKDYLLKALRSRIRGMV